MHATSIIYSLFRNINASVSILVPISLFLPTSLPTLAVPELHNSYVDSLLIFSLHVFVASLQKFVLVTTFSVVLCSLSPSLMLILLFYSEVGHPLPQPLVSWSEPAMGSVKTHTHPK